MNDAVKDPLVGRAEAAVTLIAATVAAGNAARLGDEALHGPDESPEESLGERPRLAPVADVIAVTARASATHGKTPEPPVAPPVAVCPPVEVVSLRDVVRSPAPEVVRSGVSAPPLDEALNVVVQALVEGRQDTAAVVRRALRDAALAPYTVRASVGRAAGQGAGRTSRSRGCDALPAPPLTP